MYRLWYEVKLSVGYPFGECDPGTCLFPYESVVGEVSIDASGTVTANTGLSEADEEAWIDEMAGQRWPCLAGQTIEYCCDGGI